MMQLKLNFPDIIELAPRIIWFESSDTALKDPIRFIAYALRYASYEDMKKIRKYISDETFVTILDQIPPGIVDPRSWAYWNAVLHRYPTPPIPVRKL